MLAPVTVYSITNTPFEFVLVLAGSSQVYCCNHCHRPAHRWGSNKRCLNTVLSCCPHQGAYNHKYICEWSRKELSKPAAYVTIPVAPAVVTPSVVTPSVVTPVKRTPSHTLQWQISSAQSKTSPKHKQIHRTTLKRQRDRVDQMVAFTSTVTKRIRLPGAGRKPLLGALELEIVDWIRKQRADNIQVDDDGMITQAIAIASANKIKKFEASDGWFTAFKKRHNIVLRMVTSYTRKYTDAQLDEKQREYVTALIQEIQSKEVSCTYIFNMDETPIFKDTPPRRTYDFRGVNSTPIKTTNHVKDRLTLVLCVSILGEILPPLLIFKSVAANASQFVKTVDTRGRTLYHCGQSKAYNNGEIMEKWIREIFLPNCKVPADAASMLTMDNVSFHKNPACAAALLANKVVVNTFPPNTTCRLQPLDHSINGNIKRRLCSFWTRWMRRPNPTLTPQGNLQQPQRDVIMKWVLDAVEEVGAAAVRRSFRHLLAVTDGT
jgi:hypothetical protein